jgi:hypothetical protein
MEFRWVALIALWTLISGPILGVPSGPTPASASRLTEKKAVKLVTHKPAQR